MKTRSYPLRIPKEIVTVSKLRAMDEHLDQSTALRQFLYRGAEEYILKLVLNGRISIGKASELLNINIYDIYSLAEKYNLRLGSTLEQSRKSRETAIKILR